MTDTLADRIFAATYRPERGLFCGWSDPAQKRRVATVMRQTLTRARRYIITPEVAGAAITLGIEHPDILLSMLPRARLPFECCWIEWDPRINHDALDDIPVLPKNFGDIGFLVGRISESPPVYAAQEIRYDSETQTAIPNCFSILYGTETEMRMMDPSIEKHLSPLLSVADFGTKEMGLSLVGSAYIPENVRKIVREAANNRPDEPINIETDQWRMKSCVDLVAHASYTMSAFWPHLSDPGSSEPNGPYSPERIRHLLRTAISGSSGLWRTLITILALIQARDWTSLARPERNPARQRFVGNKIVPYLQQIRVKLELPRAVILKEATRKFGNGPPKARHEVEGHWVHRHDRGDRECSHVFVNKKAVSECTLCGWQRWWRKDHMRGDATIGFVEKTRVVTRRAA